MPWCALLLTGLLAWNAGSLRVVSLVASERYSGSTSGGFAVNSSWRVEAQGMDFVPSRPTWNGSPEPEERAVFQASPNAKANITKIEWQEVRTEAYLHCGALFQSAAGQIGHICACV
jgi:hypothetical protein